MVVTKHSVVTEQNFRCIWRKIPLSGELRVAPAYAEHGEEYDGAEDENHEDGEALPCQQVVILLHGDRVVTHLHTVTGSSPTSVIFNKMSLFRTKCV